MNYRMRFRFRRLFLAFFIGWGIFLSAQYTIPKKPNILYPVYDEVGLLSEEEKTRLNQKLIKFEDSTSTEIEVIIIPTTKGEDINFLATRFGQEWGIGKKKVDNGVVFLIATEDRRFTIQQGRAVEQYLTASVAGQILDYLVAPQFKQGNWYLGIDEGTNAIMDATQGKFKKQKKSEGFPKEFIIVSVIIFIMLMIILSNQDKGGGGNRKYIDLDDDIIITRRGRRNYPGGFHNFPNFGGGGFGSSGGFGGFGGGGTFGGGGASGSW